MRRKGLGRAVRYYAVPLTAVLIGVVIAFPVIYCFLSAFKTQGEFRRYPPALFPESFFNMANIVQVFEKTPIMRFMLNSLIVAGLGTTVRILFATMAAFSFAYYDFKGKKLLFTVVLATMMMPNDTLIITNYLTISQMGLLDNYLGICITSFVGATQMFILRQHFKTLPREFYEAAQIDGCSDPVFVLRILFPVSRPVLVTLCVQSFIGLWNAYLWPLLVTNKTQMRTVQVGVTMLNTVNDTNFSLVMAAVAVLLIPSFVLFLLLRRNIVEGMSAGAIVG